MCHTAQSLSFRAGETCIPTENDEGNNQVSGELSGHSEGKELTIGGHGHVSTMDRI